VWSKEIHGLAVVVSSGLCVCCDPLSGLGLLVLRSVKSPWLLVSVLWGVIGVLDAGIIPLCAWWGIHCGDATVGRSTVGDRSPVVGPAGLVLVCGGVDPRGLGLVWLVSLWVRVDPLVACLRDPLGFVGCCLVVGGVVVVCPLLLVWVPGFVVLVWLCVAVGPTAAGWVCLVNNSNFVDWPGVIPVLFLDPWGGVIHLGWVPWAVLRTTCRSLLCAWWVGPWVGLWGGWVQGACCCVGGLSWGLLGGSVASGAG